MTTTTSRRLCPGCGASPAGCQSLRILAARTCCSSCTGNHDYDNYRKAPQ